MKSRKP